MADEQETKETSKVPFTNVLEILANKVSRKAAVVGMAMVLIYLLAATPNVASVMSFIVAIAGLAVFFTVLQWIIDLKSDNPKKKKDTNSDTPPKMGGSVNDGGKDT